jgi:hypothetical protein
MIIFQNGVLDYLDDLVFTLFKEEYFGFMQSSYDYVDKIIDFTFDNITTFPSKKTPTELKNFGSKYLFYKSNQKTTWYIFFENKNNNFLITNIINSHCEETKWL